MATASFSERLRADAGALELSRHDSAFTPPSSMSQSSWLGQCRCKLQYRPGTNSGRKAFDSEEIQHDMAADRSHSMTTIDFSCHVHYNYCHHRHSPLQAGNDHYYSLLLPLPRPLLCCYYSCSTLIVAIAIPDGPLLVLVAVVFVVVVVIAIVAVIAIAIAIDIAIIIVSVIAIDVSDADIELHCN